MELQVGVKILLKNNIGKYLLLRRAPGKYPDVKDGWDIPGGRINIDSNLLENLKREVMEETGLALTGEPQLIAAQDIMKPDKHVVRLTYIGEGNGEIVLSDEHDAFDWFSIEDLQRLENCDHYLLELIEKNRL
ncbi:MAG: NUDIX domain-containing protein [bacterium]|nr:NUDIX domain-containing protein [bacterium]